MDKVKAILDEIYGKDEVVTIGRNMMKRTLTEQLGECETPQKILDRGLVAQMNRAGLISQEQHEQIQGWLTDYHNEPAPSEDGE